ncbi:hypothetical protein [Spirosoma pollinicola]|uniref:Uncharacterized protein n=1 Tax=Spirosoma pollinicola TaxID=2057025 RepID=A0A2K8Z882_9BACT|nr:hypothetical protein [Spirosoma pollinicola]AUD06068.1 hypothetical protein CWM47_32025 [Spirosoma pollinicola]
MLKKRVANTFRVYPPDYWTSGVNSPGFDLLSKLADKGHILVKARLFEESSWTQLPLEAFDEHPVLPAIRQLEEDWQRILTKPFNGS